MCGATVLLLCLFLDRVQVVEYYTSRTKRRRAQSVCGLSIFARHPAPKHRRCLNASMCSFVGGRFRSSYTTNTSRFVIVLRCRRSAPVLAIPVVYSSASASYTTIPSLCVSVPGCNRGVVLCCASLCQGGCRGWLCDAAQCAARQACLCVQLDSLPEDTTCCVCTMLHPVGVPCARVRWRRTSTLGFRRSTAPTGSCHRLSFCSKTFRSVRLCR